VKRRAFITLLGGAAAAWPLAARGQQPTMPAVGFLGSSSAAEWGPFVTAFQRGLKETGFVEGENFTIEYRWADGQYDRLPALAADLVRRQVAVILAAGSPVPALAAKAATATIPIVFALGIDPVQFGLVASLNRPGGNITGVNFLVAHLAEKALGLIHELVPNVAVGGMFVNPNNPNADSVTRNAREMARSLGLQLHILNASTAPEIDAAFAGLVEQRIGMLLSAPDPPVYGPARSGRGAGRAPRGSGDLLRARVRHRRRLDELRNEYQRGVPPGRDLRWKNPQGCMAGRPARRAVDAIRVRHESQSRQGAGPHDSRQVARARRRGDRIAVLFAAVHMSPPGTFETSTDVRYTAAFGGNADIRHDACLLQSVLINAQVGSLTVVKQCFLKAWEAVKGLQI
jgi:hypothetical protein